MIHKQCDENVGINDFSTSVQLYYQDLKRYKPLPKEIEKELMIKAKNGDIEARNKILTANLRFVFNIAKKYRGHGVEISDLIAEGNNGMIKAIEKFDINQDVKFFSYAVWWIRQRMSAAIAKSHCNVEDSIEETMESETNDDLMNTISMEDDEEENTNINYMDDSDGLEENEQLQQKHFIVEKMLAKLDERERLIIEKYFGIEKNDEGENLETISKSLNLTTERVRQLKLKAIDEMRNEVFNIEEADFLF